MKLTKKQKDIIKKISTGEIKDIPSYLNVYNLTSFKKLNKEEIVKKMKQEEGEKTYKKLKDGVEILVTTTTMDKATGFPSVSTHTIPPKEEDFEYVSATIAYTSSSITIKNSDSKSFTYDFFEGINITNSFNNIKDFLTIWQFLKSEGLVLEVEKEVKKEDYEPFFEFKPILDTKFGKRKEREKKEIKTFKEAIETYGLDAERKVNILPFQITYSDKERYKDYRNYIDENFEYNKANELICSQFIDKQIYGNSSLETFIKNHFKTKEEISLTKTLIPAYLALFLTLGTTIWQNSYNDNSEITDIKNHLIEIKNNLNEQTFSKLNEIENKLQNIIDSSLEEKTDKLLEDILLEIREVKERR
ncbi:hypothetical protein L0P73_17640 [[Clostridium] innocuum]|uniref:hypothetical protein n=1 Tax=Clostridium innocuum TaxID=1522 RepID=UPI001EDDF753|nr:hypothetical protein [[Clostridium] innocuum]MCG4662403.1 hypothetical protein [[Clostridium] innocuum]